MEMCSIDGCAGQIHARGLCNTHYNAQLRATRKTEQEGKPVVPKICIEPDCQETQFKSYRCQPHFKVYTLEYYRAYREAHEVVDDLDYEDFWLWVKDYLKL
ncbi:hypothetical protein UFOVP45_95 [uncultured Caudovirales phage]|uniref:Uncharacterized protein n=1 Tax=uncultured Caudovirales phage TaxID=2100421 RepID=A0A6J5KT02_9CAUD|nr:hypothetical protein UFOVP45_95 [uncultured Caudovirales phage]